MVRLSRTSRTMNGSTTRLRKETLSSIVAMFVVKNSRLVTTWTIICLCISMVSSALYATKFSLRRILFLVTRSWNIDVARRIPFARDHSLVRPIFINTCSLTKVLDLINAIFVGKISRRDLVSWDIERLILRLEKPRP